MLAIVIDTSYFDKFLNASNPAEVMIQFFYSGGWIVFVYIILYGFWWLWVDTRQGNWLEAQEWVLLAIDVPKDTEQSPKAVEGIFAALHGTLSMFDRYEKYWTGKLQARFSFEIVSIGGYVQFFVRTFSKYRDVVEAAIYAQYPDAEIAEVEDYTAGAPKKFPASGWDLFGTELILMNKDQFPIRTYSDFEHSPSEDYFKDPLSALLEGLAKIKTGEQVWIQILISPNDGKEWRSKGEKIYKKLIGAKVKSKPTMLGSILELGGGVVDQMMGPPALPVKKKEEPPSMMQHMSPGEKIVVEKLQEKLAKVAFNTKLRIIYVGKKEVMSRPRVLSSIKGAFGQFTILDQNGFRIYGNATTKSDYVWQREKIFEYLSLFMTRTLITLQNSVLRAYRARSMGRGATPFVLNIEELATIFHFPMTTIKAPLLKKTEAKRAEPPFSLPVSYLKKVDEASEITVAPRTKRAPPPPTISKPKPIAKKPVQIDQNNSSVEEIEEPKGVGIDSLPFV